MSKRFALCNRISSFRRRKRSTTTKTGSTRRQPPFCITFARLICTSWKKPGRSWRAIPRPSRSRHS
ncbi:conserved hypothetical protein [Culex quinquefasciatus]|uniref:Uncharacterized protein n=1 Tax=Culex quinquefasciatus TaxID=7176 RepID=B0X1D1_CULQU|nr:conserved hypothetical protein [Culex quinquefasciatus]|eukprot:XP_001863453.1 conserved hypothetical protein [Culex quinquefasciatus]